MPPALLRLRNLATANVVGMLWAAAMFAWFFLSALYLQLVRGYTPLQVGLAFLPANLIMGAFSLGLSAKLVMRFGIRAPLSVGLSLAAIGLVLFADAPVGGQFASAASRSAGGAGSAAGDLPGSTSAARAAATRRGQLGLRLGARTKSGSKGRSTHRACCSSGRGACRGRAGIGLGARDREPGSSPCW